MSFSDAAKMEDDAQEAEVSKINLSSGKKAAVDSERSTVAQDAYGNPSARSLVENNVSRKVCGVCNEKEGKYKCTRCYLP
jgi:HIT zinc finger